MIQIKDTEILFQMLTHKAHPNLVVLVNWVFERGLLKTITCAFEERKKPSVHSTEPYRGLDCRSRGIKNPQGVCDEINGRWIYDPKRPEYKCAIHHDTGRGSAYSPAGA